MKRRFSVSGFYVLLISIGIFSVSGLAAAAVTEKQCNDGGGIVIIEGRTRKKYCDGGNKTVDGQVVIGIRHQGSFGNDERVLQETGSAVPAWPSRPAPSADQRSR